MTIYGSKRDFTTHMRDPTAPARAHAVCRRLVATADQRSHWYGAHYWAACMLLTRNPALTYCKEDNFAYEVEGHHGPLHTHKWRKVWQIALTRVARILAEAMALRHSCDW